MNLVEFIKNNLYTDDSLVQAICLAFLFMIVYDFYHALFTAILSWFKK